MTSTDKEMRFEFGQNWKDFVDRSFSEERLAVAQKKILDFTGLKDLEGFDFLDIGCGSGIHSFGAFRSKARKLHSFDYDRNSVAATQIMREKAGLPENWKVEWGDVLDQAYVDKLGKWNFVYSWGVLHHTGEMWRAVRNAQRPVAENGYFYIALYSADVDLRPSKEFWLEVKKKYNEASPAKKRMMVGWYVWRFGMSRNPLLFPLVLYRIAKHRHQRGMNYFSDVRDWLGGWPMEYAPDQEVVDILEGEYGFKLANVATGEACTEFLFIRSGAPPKRTVVTEMMAAKKMKLAAAKQAP